MSPSSILDLLQSPSSLAWGLLQDYPGATDCPQAMQSLPPVEIHNSSFLSGQTSENDTTCHFIPVVATLETEQVYSSSSVRCTSSVSMATRTVRLGNNRQ